MSEKSSQSIPFVTIVSSLCVSIVSAYGLVFSFNVIVNERSLILLRHLWKTQFCQAVMVVLLIKDCAKLLSQGLRHSE